MAKLPGSFNADDHGGMGFEPLPKGSYEVKITESDYKQNSKQNGHYLSLKREVVSGEYKGRVVYHNLNLDNPNKTAVDIANRELADTCRACGVPQPLEDSEQLHGIIHMVDYVVRKGSGDNPDSNSPVKIYAKGGSAGGSGGSKAPKPEKPKPRKKPVFEDDDED